MPRRCRAVPRGLPERPCNSPHLPSMDELQLLPLLGLAASQQASNVSHTKIWIIIVNLDRHHHRRGRLEAACAVSASRPQRGTPALLIARSCSALCAVSLLLCTWAHNPSIAQIQIPDQLPAPSSQLSPGTTACCPKGQCSVTVSLLLLRCIGPRCATPRFPEP